jgi:thiamine kinase-like enzyme
MTDLTQILARLAAILGHPDGEAQPLHGGITNLNYRVSFGGVEYVVRLPGKDTDLLGIDRHAEWIASCAAATLGIGPATGATLRDPPCLVSRFVDGREATADDLRDPAVIARVAGALRTFHDSDTALETPFDSFSIVESYAKIARDRGGDLPHDLDDQLGRARTIQAALSGPEHEPVPCHNDLLAANFIHAGDRLFIIDWEYAGMGDRYFDLANFAMNGLGEDAQAELLEAYFGEPPTPRRRAELALMGFMSAFREAMWAVVQGTASEIDFDFADHAHVHMEKLRAVATDPRFERRLEDARAPRG